MKQRLSMDLKLTNLLRQAFINSQNLPGPTYIELGLKSCKTLLDYKVAEHPSSDQMVIYSSLVLPVCSVAMAVVKRHIS